MTQMETVDLSNQTFDIRQHCLNDSTPGLGVGVVVFGNGLHRPRRVVMVLQPDGDQPRFFDFTDRGTATATQLAQAPDSSFTPEMVDEWIDNTSRLPGVKEIKVIFPAHAVVRPLTATS